MEDGRLLAGHPRAGRVVTTAFWPSSSSGNASQLMTTRSWPPSPSRASSQLSAGVSSGSSFRTRASPAPEQSVGRKRGFEGTHAGSRGLARASAPAICFAGGGSFTLASPALLRQPSLVPAPPALPPLQRTSAPAMAPGPYIPPGEFCFNPGFDFGVQTHKLDAGAAAAAASAAVAAAAAGVFSARAASMPQGQEPPPAAAQGGAAGGAGRFNSASAPPPSQLHGVKILVKPAQPIQLRNYAQPMKSPVHQTPLWMQRARYMHQPPPRQQAQFPPPPPQAPAQQAPIAATSAAQGNAGEEGEAGGQGEEEGGGGGEDDEPPHLKWRRLSDFASLLEEPSAYGAAAAAEAGFASDAGLTPPAAAAPSPPPPPASSAPSLAAPSPPAPPMSAPSPAPDAPSPAPDASVTGGMAVDGAAAADAVNKPSDGGAEDDDFCIEAFFAKPDGADADSGDGSGNGNNASVEGGSDFAADAFVKPSSGGVYSGGAYTDPTGGGGGGGGLYGGSMYSGSMYSGGANNAAYSGAAGSPSPFDGPYDGGLIPMECLPPVAPEAFVLPTRTITTTTGDGLPALGPAMSAHGGAVSAYGPAVSMYGGTASMYGGGGVSSLAPSMSQTESLFSTDSGGRNNRAAAVTRLHDPMQFKPSYFSNPDVIRELQQRATGGG